MKVKASTQGAIGSGKLTRKTTMLQTPPQENKKKKRTSSPHTIVQEPQRVANRCVSQKIVRFPHEGLPLFPLARSIHPLFIFSMDTLITFSIIFRM